MLGCAYQPNVQSIFISIVLFRKAFLTKLSNEYPALSKENLKETFPPKESIGLTTVITSSEDTVLVYFVQNVPMAFSYRDQLFPTLFLLWRHPDALFSFAMHDGVLGFLQKGADCMLPGIQKPVQDLSLGFQKGEPAYLSTSTNRAAVAVGVTALSSTEMRVATTGKALLVYHVLGDKLCREVPEQRPCLGVIDYNQSVEPSNDFEMPEAESDRLTEVFEESLNLPEDEESDTKEDMDELLITSFLTALKYSKDLSLPILVSAFYKKHMLSTTNANKLDLKKSSYKKLGKFLEEMCNQSIIEAKELSPGALSITKVHKDHEKLKYFKLDKELRPQPPPKENKSIVNVSLCYRISDKTVTLFQHTSYTR